MKGAHEILEQSYRYLRVLAGTGVSCGFVTGMKAFTYACDIENHFVKTETQSTFYITVTLHSYMHGAVFRLHV